MGLLDKFFKGEEGITSVSVFGNGQTSTLETASEQYREGYLRNPYVKRACDLYGVRVASIDPMFYDLNGNEVDIDTSADPFVKLMMQPNPTMTGKELMQRIGLSYGIFGEAFLYAEKTPTGWMLWFLDPMIMSANESMDITEPVMAWRSTRAVHGKTNFLPEEIIHIKNPNPDITKPRGLSPMVGCAKSVVMQNNIREWNISTTRNGGKPGVCLEIPGPITADNRERLKDELNGQYGGAHNTGRGVVLDNGKKMTMLGMTAVEMDFANAMTMCGKEIAIAYGIPSEKLGDVATKTYSNSVEASREEITNTIKPLLELIYAPIWAFFKGTNIAKGISEFTYDVEQLTDNMGAQVELYTALQTTTFLTPNEKRAKLGYEPIDNPIADELMLSPADTPMSDYADVPLDNGDDLYRLLQDGQ